jgi:hypothetical protein
MLDLYQLYNYSENNKKIERMTVVGECNKFYTPPKEQVPKRPLELISQVDGTTTGRNSGERVYTYATKGEGSHH